MKGVFSLEESLESLKSFNSLESLENRGFLLCFPQSGASLESLDSLESLENGPFWKDLFFKRLFFRSRIMTLFCVSSFGCFYIVTSKQFLIGEYSGFLFVSTAFGKEGKRVAKQGPWTLRVVTLPSRHRPPHLSSHAPQGLLRVLDGAREGLCGWKSGQNLKTSGDPKGLVFFFRGFLMALFESARKTMSVGFVVAFTSFFCALRASRERYH